MLGARIALLRRKRNMSQLELAKQLEISPSAVGMYEQGRREPDCAMLVRMAELFGVSTDFLLTGRPDAAAQSLIREQFVRALQEAEAVTLRNAAGEERPISAEELSLLFAALLGD